MRVKRCDVLARSLLSIVYLGLGKTPTEVLSTLQTNDEVGTRRYNAEGRKIYAGSHLDVDAGHCYQAHFEKFLSQGKD